MPAPPPQVCPLFYFAPARTVPPRHHHRLTPLTRCRRSAGGTKRIGGQTGKAGGREERRKGSAARPPTGGRKTGTAKYLLFSPCAISGSSINKTAAVSPSAAPLFLPISSASYRLFPRLSAVSPVFFLPHGSAPPSETVPCGGDLRTAGDPPPVIIRSKRKPDFFPVLPPV